MLFNVTLSNSIQFGSWVDFGVGETWGVGELVGFGVVDGVTLGVNDNFGVGFWVGDLNVRQIKLPFSFTHLKVVSFTFEIAPNFLQGLPFFTADQTSVVGVKIKAAATKIASGLILTCWE